MFYRALTFFLFFVSSFQSSLAYAETEISNSEQLLNIALNLSEDYLLNNDIDLSEVSLDDKDYYIASTFTGTLNGNNFTIYGLSRPLFQEINGLTRIIDDASEIDLAVINDINLVTSESGVLGQGILANSINSNSRIENVNVAGKIDASALGVVPVGGIAGQLAEGFNSNSTILDSSAKAVVIGVDNIGGLIGTVGANGSIVTSFADGEVIGRNRVGGLVGYNVGNVSESFASGDVSGNDDVGGLIGTFANATSVYNSYSDVAVQGNLKVGGLVGTFLYGQIRNSFALGSVVGNSNVGGLVGYSDYNASITNSYSISSVTGDELVGQLVGQSSYSVIISSSSGFGRINVAGEVEEASPGSPQALEIINTLEYPYGDNFEQEACRNNSRPFLTLQIAKFEDECVVDSADNGEREAFNKRLFLQLQEISEYIESPLSIKNFQQSLANSELKRIGMSIELSANESKKFGIIKFESGNRVSFKIPTESNIQLKIQGRHNSTQLLWLVTEDGTIYEFGNIEFSENSEAVLPPLSFSRTGIFKLYFSEDRIGQSVETLESKSQSIITLEVR